MFTFTPAITRSEYALANAMLNMTDLATRTVSANATDVIDTGDAFVLEIELPGYEKENISVSLKTKYLTIEAKAKVKASDAEEGEVEVKYLRRGRVKGDFSRTYTVQNIDESGIEAAYENGVLTVTLPKIKPIEPETHRFTVK